MSRGYNPDTLSPDQQQPQNMMVVQQQQQLVQGPGRITSATPTMQQRIKALGVATPLAMSSPVRRSVYIRIPLNITVDKFSMFYLSDFILISFLSLSISPSFVEKHIYIRNIHMNISTLMYRITENNIGGHNWKTNLKQTTV